MARHRTSLGGELAGLGAAPEVIGRRGLRLAGLAASGSPAFMREWQRMHMEKAEAVLEGQWAMGWEALRLQQRWGTAVLAAWLQPWNLSGALGDIVGGIPRDAEAVLASAVAPARRKVQANRRRLRRSR